MSGKPLDEGLDPLNPDGGEVRRRAAEGALLVGARGLAIRSLGFVGTLVLARVLLPEDFGVLALANTLLFVGYFLADGGVGAALIREAAPPAREDLRALLGFELLLVAVLLLVALPLVFAFTGGDAAVITLMLASLPIYVCRMPSFVVLERALLYRPVVAVEIAELVSFYVIAIPAVIAGGGLWALAVATMIRTVVGTALLTRRAPGRVVLPGWNWQRTRRVLRFGLQLQGIGALNVAREQVVNIGTGVISGLAVLGLWSLAFKLLQIPLLLFESLFRVSYPGMARLISAGEDPVPVAVRSVRLTAVAGGFFLVPLAASAPALVPGAFGSRWEDAAAVLPPACLALAIAGPVSVGVSGLLLARGHSGAVLKTAVLNNASWAIVSLGLLPVLGVVALGIGWLVAALVDAVVLARAARRHLGMRAVRPMLAPATAAALAGGCGLAVASLGDATIGVAILSGLAGEIAYGILLMAVARGPLTELIRFSIHHAWRPARLRMPARSKTA